MDRSERDRDDGASETDDVVRHAEVWRRKHDEQRLRVDAHELRHARIPQQAEITIDKLLRFNKTDRKRWRLKPTILCNLTYLVV